ncbi:Heparanase protein 1 [Spatholobus suberectus]|nr:Heparanase protein 1 [Spatholobus suberectus]
MDVKVTLCYVLLLLFSLSSAENVKLIVQGARSIATTDDNFICATLDWWPANKCDYDQCPWGQAGILNLDLVTKFYQMPSRAAFPERDGMKVKLTFGLNALTGKTNSAEDKLNWVGDWNPNNAISLMKYTISKGYKIDSYEFGNELCAEGVSARVDSVQYAKDITRLRHIVNLLYPNASPRPKVLGPAGFYDKEWFDSFLQNVGPGVVDGVTHHIYNLGAGVDKDLIKRVQDPHFLSKIAKTYKSVAGAVKEFTPWAAPWVGEAGGAYNSGGKDVSHTFANGFWYLGQLGMTSTLNHKVYCRQTLIGGNYGLLNTTTFIPNPDYYGALLWHWLMGSDVLSVSHDGSPFLRTYAHCSKKGPGIIVLLINMSNSTIFNVSLVNDMNLYPETVDMTMREEYHLTPKDGNIQSDVVRLNGTPLELTKSLDIPEMKPKLVDPSSPIKVGPDSIVFVHSKSFNAPACR